MPAILLQWRWRVGGSHFFLAQASLGKKYIRLYLMYRKTNKKLGIVVNHLPSQLLWKHK
jgi:hypothetical protein